MLFSIDISPAADTNNLSVANIQVYKMTHLSILSGNI